jgi:transglutaminase-like putative cysteine protease
MSNLLVAGAPIGPLGSPTLDVDGHTVPALLAVGCSFDFEVPRPVHAVVIVEPHESEGGRIVEECFTAPDGVTTSTYRDVFGNQCRRLQLPAGHATFSYRATVTNDAGFDAVGTGAAEHDPALLPDDVMGFLLPSRFCPSDELASVAWDRFGALDPGWSRVESVVGWVNEHLTFRYGASSPTMSAAGAYANGAGVCRDFAHLAITMCRALSIPARYVVGYLPDIAVPDPGTPMDFCAWTEVYVGDRWYTFDPRNHGQRRIGRTVIGRGRDAADVAMTTTFGQATLLDMQVTAEGATT